MSLFKKYRFSACLLALFFVATSFAQDDLDALLSDGGEEGQNISSTFKTSRIINTHSTELVKPRHLDFRVAHRFGDIAGVSGGYQTMFGIDNASDIGINFEYGLMENITLGFGRTKGGNGLKNIASSLLKFKLLSQSSNNKIPISLVFLGHAAFSYMASTDDLALISSFPKLSHRLSYISQMLIARKFSNSFSLQITPSYIHRNLVHFEDENSLFALGIGGRLKLSKRFGLIADYVHVFRKNVIIDNTEYTSPLALGIEIETGGHVFHLNFTNSRSLHESQYLPYTSSKYSDGQYRFGFNISRVFVL